jgi:hypothetical protein
MDWIVEKLIKYYVTMWVVYATACVLGAGLLAYIFLHFIAKFW